MSQTAEAAQWAKAEAVETLTNKKLGKIEASTTTEDMMPATNSKESTGIILKINLKGVVLS